MKAEDYRRKVRLLEVKARALLALPLMGEWASNVIGTGLEFRDLREYVPGDDIRRIDWKATARTGRPQMRQFREDRQQGIHLILDLSASLKTDGLEDRAQELVALLGWTAVLKGDKFSLTGWSDRLEFHRPPAKGEAQLWTALRDLVSITPGGRGTDLPALWTWWSHHLSHRSTLILITYLGGELGLHQIQGLTARHDVWIFHLGGAALPESGVYPLQDGETGETLWVDLGGGRREELLEAQLQAQGQIRREVTAVRGWYHYFPGDKPILQSLMDFLQRRERLIHV